MRGRKSRTETTASSSRFDRFSRADLIDLVEATMMRNGEMFRGLSHSELDQAWVLDRLEAETMQQLEAIRALRRKVDLQTF